MGPLVGAAAVSGGANLLGNIFNVASQNRQNKLNREFTREMYGTQRQDALADWHMNNEYNDPKNQMARLKAAGLNPHLVYGSGGGSVSSSDVRGANASGGQGQAGQVDAGSLGRFVLEFMNMQVQQKQMDVMEKEMQLKDIDARIKESSLQTMDQDRYIKRTMLPYQTSALEAEIAKRHADTKYTLDQNERAAALQGHTIKQAIENVLMSRMQRSKIEVEKQHIRQQIINLKKDATLKDKDIELRNQGVNPGDPAWWRVIMKGLNIMDDGKPGTSEGLQDGFKKGFMRPPGMR